MHSSENGLVLGASLATAGLGTSEIGGRHDREEPGDPLAAVFALDPRGPLGGILVATLLALGIHAGAIAGAVEAAVLGAFTDWAQRTGHAVAGRLAQTYDIEVVKPPEPAPTPTAEPEEKPKPEPESKVKEPPREEPVAAPPAAANAAKVLTAEPVRDREEPVDLTGNTFLNGTAETAVGGTTQIGGTARVPTNSPNAVATGVRGGTGLANAPVVPGVDRSRPAQIMNKSNLERCPFPAEADADQIDEAAVGIEVRVGVSGRADAVTVTRDPGHGFGREARKCALRETYTPALNGEGAAIPGVYRVNFRFSR